MKDEDDDEGEGEEEDVEDGGLLNALHSRQIKLTMRTRLKTHSFQIRYSKVIFHKCLCLKMVCPCRAFDFKHNGIVVFCVT